MKKTVGLFEAKTRFSELCDQVAVTHEGVTVTRHGKPLVRIIPVEERPMTILERRRQYMEIHAADEPDDREDFEPAPRARDTSRFELGD